MAEDTNPTLYAAVVKLETGGEVTALAFTLDTAVAVASLITGIPYDHLEAKEIHEGHWHVVHRCEPDEEPIAAITHLSPSVLN